MKCMCCKVWLTFTDENDSVGKTLPTAALSNFVWGLLHIGNMMHLHGYAQV